MKRNKRKTAYAETENMNDMYNAKCLPLSRAGETCEPSWGYPSSDEDKV